MKQASNNLSKQTGSNEKGNEIVRVAVMKGLDANKVNGIKVDLDSDRWTISPQDGRATALNLVTTPDALLAAVQKEGELASALRHQRGVLAAHLFNIATECKSLYEFEAFCIQLAFEAGWDKYPEQFRNYKSRITTNWKDTSLPAPDAELELPKLTSDGKVIEGKVEKRNFRNLLEYYDYCKAVKDAKTNAAAAAKKEAEKSPEQAREEMHAILDKGKTDEPATATAQDDTQPATPAPVEVPEDEEGAHFAAMLGELQVLFASADINGKQKATKRVQSLIRDLKKDAQKSAA